jgi:hypothetical protein
VQIFIIYSNTLDEINEFYFLGCLFHNLYKYAIVVGHRGIGALLTARTTASDSDSPSKRSCETSSDADCD